MTITLLRGYLLHDFKQLTQRLSLLRSKDGEGRVLAQHNDGESDDQLAQRLFITGVSRLRKTLRDYLENDTADARDTLDMDTRDRWQFRFRRPLGDARGLAGLMHWFVVRLAVSEWADIFAPAEAAKLKGDAEFNLSEVVDWLWDAPMPVKHHVENYRPSTEIDVEVEEETEIELTYEPDV